MGGEGMESGGTAATQLRSHRPGERCGASHQKAIENPSQLARPEVKRNP